MAQGFLLAILGFLDRVLYRKSEQRLMQLDVLLHEWYLEPGGVLEYPEGPAITGQLSLRSDLVLPWLLKHHTPASRGSERHIAAGQLANRWLQLAQGGLEGHMQFSRTVKVDTW